MKDQAQGIEMDGMHALQWARELSKLPDGYFTVMFYPYSRKRDQAGTTLTVKEHCKWRTQWPNEKYDIAPDNLFLFLDENGDPKMCYRVLIRFMAFSQDGYKLHKINWLGNERSD